MSVVASGHISEDPEEQIRELRAVAETGVDAVVLISNRSDIENTGSDAWIRETERLLNALPSETVVGTYECPMPYKRLLDDKMVEWIAKSGRFAFIKDTCCDALLIKRRIELLFFNLLVRLPDHPAGAAVFHRPEVRERLRPRPFVAPGVAEHRLETPFGAG